MVGLGFSVLMSTRHVMWTALELGCVPGPVGPLHLRQFLKGLTVDRWLHSPYLGNKCFILEGWEAERHIREMVHQRAFPEEVRPAGEVTM